MNKIGRNARTEVILLIMRHNTAIMHRINNAFYFLQDIQSLDLMLPDSFGTAIVS